MAMIGSAARQKKPGSSSSRFLLLYSFLGIAALVSFWVNNIVATLGRGSFDFVESRLDDEERRLAKLAARKSSSNSNDRTKSIDNAKANYNTEDKHEALDRLTILTTSEKTPQQHFHIVFSTGCSAFQDCT